MMLNAIPEKKMCNVCQQPAVLACAACQLVYYCTPEHQESDRNSHNKNNCPSTIAYEITQSMEFGRHLRATRHCEPGAILFTEKPLVFGPKRTIIRAGESFPCVGCCRLLTEDSYEKCLECQWPVCSQSQCPGIKSSAGHALECQMLQLNQPAGEFYDKYRFDVLIVLRVLIVQKRYPEKWDVFLKFDDRLDQRGPGSDTFKSVEDTIKYLQQNSYLTATSNDLIHKICGILDLHAVEVETTDDRSAQVLYATASLIKHNCTPNVAVLTTSSDDFEVTVRAGALGLAAGDHLTTSYANILWGTHCRRHYLKKNKYFWCKCERCCDPSELSTFFSALKCWGVSEAEPCGGTQLPIASTDEKIKWICNKCKIKLPNRDIMKFVNHLGREVEKVLGHHQRMERNVQDLEEVLEKLLKFLHPNHYHVFSVKYALTELYDIQMDESDAVLQRKLEYCNDLSAIIEKIDPGNAVLSYQLASVRSKKFRIKFVLLSRSYKGESQAVCIETARELKELLQEIKHILRFDTKSLDCSKLYNRTCYAETKFQSWMDENQITFN